MPTLELPNQVTTNSSGGRRAVANQGSDASQFPSGVGDPGAAEELLPLVYDELRQLARMKMSSENAGHTLNPTALVHEAYLRLVGKEADCVWDSRGHFFAAAAEAMRRILVEKARRKSRQKHGGGRNRVELEYCDFGVSARSCDVLAIDEALDRLMKEDELAGRIVHLRYFAGMSIEEAASLLGISRASAYRYWSFARAWLHCELQDQSDEDSVRA